MIIHSLWAEYVAGIETKREIILRDSGINLISGPNESGKSTFAQVPFFLINFPASSKKEVIKSLKNVQYDQGPLMGMEFSIQGNRYSITKRWLKNSITEFRQISPKVSQSTGDKAETEFKEVIESARDENYWNLLNSVQGKGTDIFDYSNSLTESSFLQNALDLAASEDSDEDDAEPIIEAISDEYSEFWTEGGKRTTRAGTKGARVVELERELKVLEGKQLEKERALSKAQEVAVASTTQQIDQDKLQKIRNVQLAAKEWRSRSVLKKSLDTKSANVSEAIADYPTAEAFDLSTYSVAEGTQGAFKAFNSLQRIRITALRDLKIDINEVPNQLNSGQSLEQAITSGLVINLPEIVKIEFPGDATGKQLEADYSLHKASLGKLGVSSLEEATLIKRAYDRIEKTKDDLNNFLSQSSTEEIEANFAASEEIRASYGEFWEEALSSPEVSESDLVKAVEVASVSKGVLQGISEQRYLEDLIDIQSKSESLRNSHAKLVSEAKALKLLLEIVMGHRQSAGKEYSQAFSERLNEISQEFFGGDSIIEVDEEFNILERSLGGITLPIKSLSVGAQEQIAILIRLTLSLISSELDPLPLILDDEFGFTDPVRLERIIEVLRSREDLQIILFTCNPGKFVSAQLHEIAM